MNDVLVRLCAAHGIEPGYTGADGITRDVPAETLAALAAAFGIAAADVVDLPDIDAVRAEPSPARCFVPEALRQARVWGITCQVLSLASARNHGMGDFADLEAMCLLASAEGADFVGVNPLHALFWSDAQRVSPFFPSNRRFLNPLYIALDRVEGFAGLTDDERAEVERLRGGPVIDVAAVARLKDRVLRVLFSRYPWTAETRAVFAAFRDAGGEALTAHALFEAISEAMVADGYGATPPDWEEPLRQRGSPEVAAFAKRNRAKVDYQLWLQWVAHAQLERVQRIGRNTGMRIGLYLDFAVGAAPDGSAAWTDTALTVPGVSIGAPPDSFSTEGQNWGLAPLSPVRLASLDGRPLVEIMASVLRAGGAMRIDHAMGLARLWLIPQGAPAVDGAYVRYPLSALLAHIAETSESAGTLIIGEDLGLVPPGFRELMTERAVHSYKVFFFERAGEAYSDPRRWPVDAIACVATHDMPSFAGWWHGHDVDVRRSLGLLTADIAKTARSVREAERRALCNQLDCPEDAAEGSARLHGLVASSPCRLAVLQIEDALGLTGQVNIPGTIGQYPNWRHRLPVTIDRLTDDPIFRAHTSAMRSARPR